MKIYTVVRGISQFLAWGEAYEFEEREGGALVFRSYQVGPVCKAALELKTEEDCGHLRDNLHIQPGSVGCY